MALLKRTRLTLSGYIRESFAHDVPLDIINLSITYYCQMEIAFDVFSHSLSGMVRDDCFMISNQKPLKLSSPYTTFAASAAWNHGVHSFSVQQVPAADTRMSSAAGAIGLVSSELLDKCRRSGDFYFLFANDVPKCVMYCLDGNGTVYGIAGDGSGYRKLSKSRSWKDGDTITLKVDCETWTLTFFCNQKRIANVDMDASKTYHAAVSMWIPSHSCFQLVECPDCIF